MGANEEEIKIRERLVRLETKLDLLSGLLQEIRDGLKETPTKEEYDKLSKRLAKVEQTQNTQMVKIGSIGAVLGMIGGMLIKFLMQ